MTINWSMKSRNDVTFVQVVYEPEAPSLELWIHAMDDIIEDDHYQAGMGFVLDRRNVSAVSSTEEVRGAIDYLKRHLRYFKGSRWAVLQGNLASVGMARMGQILSDNLPITVNIFSDLDEAENWLCS
jgi:hypothetical protein